MSTTTNRPLYEIAADIKRTWARPYFGVAPYLQAMSQLDKITDRFYDDDAKSIVVYALSNMTTFRGDDARRLKAELKALIK